MKPETAKAVERVRASLEGKHRYAERTMVEDKATGNMVPALSVPWAENFAGDVVELCTAVPMERLTPEAKMLWRGCKDLHPERRVMNHCSDLWDLLELLGPSANGKEG